MSLNRYRWNLLPGAPESLLAKSGLPRLVVQLLFNRGIIGPANLESFLNGDWRLCADPLRLPDMALAVSRVYRALLSGESIAVYGDFDADGVTSTALLVQGLTTLGGKVAPYIPHRQTEGYGLSVAALEGLRAQGVSLVISVDCGITNVAEVRKARRMGLDVIVTDHHTPLQELPPALALVNPRLKTSTYPFPDLAGVGVAFKLLQALLQSMGRGEEVEGVTDLVALGTIADMSPLLGDNRYLVKQGLKVLNASPRLGICQLASVAGLKGSLNAEDVSWSIAPRLNAAGRIDHALVSYNLLTTSSPEEAARLACWLEQKNGERQQLTAGALARAREQVLSRELTPLLVASDPDYPVGIAGLVASRLCDEFYRPAVVVRLGDTVSSGSCRSIPEFNIVAALGQCQGKLLHFGGHSQAAGFRLATRELPGFCEQLIAIAGERLAGVELRPRLDIDAEVSLPGLGGDTFRLSQMLEPFGRGNPTPVFLSRGVEMLDCRNMGANAEHLRLKLKQGGTVWGAVGFRLGECRGEIPSRVDIVYNLELDRWNGEEQLRLNMLDIGPAA